MTEAPIPERSERKLDENWRDRERRLRWESEVGSIPVWEQQDWFYRKYWQDAPDGTLPIRHHFPRKHPTDPALILYTQSEEKGQRDIQTPIKPGRYLSKYFGDVLTPKQIAYYATWQITGERVSGFTDEKHYPLHFATTGDAIVQVYQDGPQSCMRGEDAVRVYAAGDLAIAWLECLVAGHDKHGKPIARALVWPDRKVFGRIYPTDCNWQSDGFANYGEAQDCASALESRLKALGYSSTYEGSASFDGARLAKDEIEGDTYAMPYLDQGYGVDDGGDYWLMSRCADHACDNTDGTLSVAPERYAYCEHCESDIMFEGDAHTVATRVRHGSGSSYETWCEYCVEHYTFTCQGIDETFSDRVDCVEIYGETYTLAWAEDNAYVSDLSGDWFITDDDPPHTRSDGETWATSENDDGPEDLDEDEDAPATLPPVSPTINDPRQIEAPLVAGRLPGEFRAGDMVEVIVPVLSLHAYSSHRRHMGMMLTVCCVLSNEDLEVVRDGVGQIVYASEVRLIEPDPFAARAAARALAEAAD